VIFRDDLSNNRRDLPLDQRTVVSVLTVAASCFPELTEDGTGFEKEIPFTFMPLPNFTSRKCYTRVFVLATCCDIQMQKKKGNHMTVILLSKTYFSSFTSTTST
jgi:hypothetical protein